MAHYSDRHIKSMLSARGLLPEQIEEEHRAARVRSEVDLYWSPEACSLRAEAETRVVREHTLTRLAAMRAEANGLRVRAECFPNGWVNLRCAASAAQLEAIGLRLESAFDPHFDREYPIWRI